MDDRYDGQVDVLMLDLPHLKVLSSVAAAEVFSALSSDQLRSAAEVAAEIGRAPASVTEHLNKLCECGLVVVGGTRRSRSRTERLYVHRGKITRMSFRGQPWENVEQYLVRFRGLMSLTERQHEAFWRAVQVDPEFAAYGRFIRGSYYLTAEQSARLREALESAMQLASAMHEPDPERRTDKHVRVAFGAYFFPTVAESRRRSGGDENHS